MISFTSKLKDEATPFLKKITPALMKYLEKEMKRHGADMEREIKESLSIGGRRGVTKVSHSPAGQPPYLQTGRLRASIGYEVKTKKDEVILDIGAIRGGEEVNYARDLELGRSNMAARPYLMPKVVIYFDKFKKFFKTKMNFK